MNAGAGPPPDTTTRTPGAGSRAQERFGHVTAHESAASAPGGDAGGYLVRDGETGVTYACDSIDIVTEGLRTLRPGERVRFITGPGTPGHATYVIRLDLPEAEEFYS
jgi:hypothetical protein